MNNQQTCESCRYFSLYYIKRQTRFDPLDFGHCKKINGYPHKLKSDSCVRFEIAQNTHEQQKETFAKILHKMARQINDMAIILKTDDL